MKLQLNCVHFHIRRQEVLTPDVKLEMFPHIAKGECGF
jgi:hypothetical protein